jgi:hypothetical protein
VSEITLPEVLREIPVSERLKDSQNLSSSSVCFSRWSWRKAEPTACHLIPLRIQVSEKVYDQPIQYALRLLSGKEISLTQKNHGFSFTWL